MLGNQKIRIRLKGYDRKQVAGAVDEIVLTVRRSGGRIAGPIPLPTKIHQIDVQRSTFTDKKSHDQFVMKVHRRVLDILEPTQQTIDELSKLELANGLNVEIRLLDAK